MSLSFGDGCLIIGRARGAPVRIHWSWPVSALLLTRGIDPVAWGGFALLTLVHELGHAFLVRRYGLPVRAIDLHGLGGECRYQGHPSAFQVSVIAWGGVAAQALVLIPVAIALGFVSLPPEVASLRYTLLWTNLYVIALNLLPIAPLDGAEAWRLFSRWSRSNRELRQYLAERAAASAREDALRQRARARAEARNGELPPEIARQFDAAVDRGRAAARKTEH